MTFDNVIHEIPEKTLFSPDRFKCQLFRPFFRPTFGFLTSMEPNPEWSAGIPEPVKSRRWNEFQLIVSKSRVQIHSENSLQKLLFEKPFFHPHESHIAILHRDRHRGLADTPLPQFLWNGSQDDAQSTDDHEQQSAGGELVLLIQDPLQKFQHIAF